MQRGEGAVLIHTRRVCGLAIDGRLLHLRPCLVPVPAVPSVPSVSAVPTTAAAFAVVVVASAVPMAMIALMPLLGPLWRRPTGVRWRRALHGHEQRAATSPPALRRLAALCCCRRRCFLGPLKPALIHVRVDGVRIAAGVVRPQRLLKEADRVQVRIGALRARREEGGLLWVGKRALHTHDDARSAVDVAGRA
jgi:hypothetical protein